MRPRSNALQPAHFKLVADIDQTHWWFVGRRRIMSDVLASVVPPRPDAIVVDVGCGPGANIAALTDRYSCIGIDTSADAIDHASERFPEVRFVCGEAPGDLGDAAGRADAFLLMDVLEHVEHDREMLASIIGAMAPGAVLMITVPADMRLWSEQDERIGHHRRYDPMSLRRLWSGMPVQELMVSHFNSRLYLPILAVRTVSRLTGRSWGDEGSDMREAGGPLNTALTRLFTGESRRLVERAHEPGRRGYRRGVSLMAVIRRGDPGAEGEARG